MVHRLTIPQVIEEAAANFPLQRLSLIILLVIGAAALFRFLGMLSTAWVLLWKLIIVEELPIAAALQRAFNSPFVSHTILTAGALGLVTT